MPKLIGPGFLTALALALLLALGGGQALATHVQCGDVITQDTRLDSDLIDCPREGIVIGADDVTLDLNRHMIDGASTSSLHFAMGVTRPPERLTPQHNVTIENGSIQDFAIGVEFGHMFGLRISALDISRTRIGLEVGGGGVRVERNFVHDNALSGVNVFGSSGSVITRNSVADNGYRGIWVNAGSRQLVERNVVSRNRTGISVGEGADNVVARNLVFANAVGIDATESAYRTIIERNVARANSGDGIQAGCCQGQVLRNLAVGNGDDGIYAAQGGIDEFGPIVVSRNTAGFNSDLGIDTFGSGVGVLDGGGNRAFANGNPLQCLNVLCKTRAKPGNW